MPRGRKAGSVTETLEQQIGKAQQKVIKTKQAYDTAVGALQKLLDKRDAQRKEDCGMQSSKVKKLTMKS